MQNLQSYLDKRGQKGVKKIRQSITGVPSSYIANSVSWI